MSVNSRRLLSLVILLSLVRTAKLQMLRGDKLIGAMFPISLRSKIYPGRCDPVMNAQSLLRVEEFIFAVKRVNKDKTVLNNSTLGFELRDHCDSDSKAVKIITAFFDEDKTKKKIAVINDGDFKQIFQQSLAGLLSSNDPQIPLFSLSQNKENIEEKASKIFEMVPSSSRQVQGMKYVMKYFDWSFVIVVSMNDEDGKSRLKTFLESIGDDDIGIAKSIQMASAAETERAIEDIESSTKTVNVIVLLTPQDVSYNLIVNAAIKNIDVVWLATEESWDMDRSIPPRLMNTMGGLICIGAGPPLTQNEFTKYLNDTEFQTNRLLNPWYSHETKDILLNISNKHSGIITDVVYTIAHALEMKYNDSEGESDSIARHLKRVHFRSPSGREISLNEEGKLKDIKYLIYNLQQSGSQPEYVEIGYVSLSEDDGDNIELKARNQDIRWGSSDSKGVPTSRCSEPCRPGWYAAQDPNKSVKTCYMCLKCPVGEYSTTYNAKSCDIIPWKQLQAWVTYGVIGAFLLLIIFIMVIFCRFPAGYEIRYCSNATMHLLCSLILTSLLPAALFLPVEPFYCDIYNGAYTLCLGIPIAILISQSKCFRDGVYQRKTEQPESRGCVCDPQPAIYTAIFFITLAVAGIFIFYLPSEVLKVESSGKILDECSSHSNHFFLILFFYVILLACVLFLVSMKSMKHDMGEYDTASVCYCLLIFFVLCFLYFFARNTFVGPYKIIALAGINFCHAFNFLFVIFIPKLCMIHYHVQDNRPKISFLSPYELSHAQEKVSERLSNTLPRDNLSPLLPQRVMVHDESVKENGETTRF